MGCGEESFITIIRAKGCEGVEEHEGLQWYFCTRKTEGKQDDGGNRQWATGFAPPIGTP